MLKSLFLGGKFFFAAFLEIRTSYLGYSTSFLTLERVFNYIMLLNPISGAKSPVFGAKKPFFRHFFFFFSAFLELRMSYLVYSTSFLTLKRVFN